MKHSGTLTMKLDAAAPSGLPSGHLAKINMLQAKKGKRPLSEEEVLARFVRLTGNQITSIFTRFRRADLEAMAQQVNGDGGPLISAHVTDDRPIGTFYTATLAEEDGTLWLDTYAYWLNDGPGQKLAADIDGGIINEASIGWWYEEAICSVCNQDYLGGDCWHWRGETYQVKDPETDETTESLCYIWTIDCEFAEGSIVYAGAHPNTRVGGELTTQEPVLLQAHRHPTRFQAAASKDMLAVLSKVGPSRDEKPGKTLAPAAGQESERRENAMTISLRMPDGSVKELEATELQAVLDEQLALAQTKGQQLRLEEVAAALGLEPKDTTPEMLSQIKEQAMAGKAYRESLLKRLEASAMAVEGKPEKAERIRRLGDRAELSDLEELTADWEAKQQAMFPAGRESQDAPEQSNGKVVADFDSV